MKPIHEQTDLQSRTAIRQWERQFVAFAMWCSPLLFCVGWCVAGMLPNFLLFLQPIRGIETAITSRMAIVAGVLLAVLPMVWWLSLRLLGNERLRWGGIASTATTVLLVSGFSALLDHGKLRFVLEEAVKTRAPQLDFVRNVTFKQQQLRSPPETPSNADGRVIVLVGSSQINLGIDPQQLSRETADSSVISVCMPGMVPIQYLALAKDLLNQRPTHVVCWVSEFDFFREHELPATRLRWCMDRYNYPQLINTLTASQRFEQRSNLADLKLASICSIWQQRDLLRLIGYRFWWRWDVATDGDAHVLDADEAAIGARLVDQDQGIANVRNNVQRTPMVEANFVAFENFIKLMDDAGINVLVIEGELHPEAMKAYSDEFRDETRKRLLSMSEHQRHFTYVSQFDRPTFLESEWRDAVHFNEQGRRKLTQCVAQQIINIPIPIGTQ